MSQYQRLVNSILANTNGNGNTNILLNLPLLQVIGPTCTILYSLFANHTKVHAKHAIMNGGWLYYDQKYIMKNSGYGRTVIIKAIQNLDELGLIEKKLDRRLSPLTLYRVMSYEIDNNKVKSHLYTWDQTNIEEHDRAIEERTGMSTLRTSMSTKRTCSINPSFNADIAQSDPPIKYNIYKNISPISDQSNSLRRSIPKKEQSNSPKREKYSEQEYHFSEFVVNKIYNNYPTAFSQQSKPKKIEDGAIALHKLVKEYKGDFNFIKRCMEWALDEPFWKTVFKSLTEVHKVKKGKDNSKFENMAAQYLQSQKDPVDDFDNTITKAIKDIISQNDYYENTDVDAVFNECNWFMNRLNQLNKNNRKKFHWHNDQRKLVSVLKWCLIDVETNVVYQKDICDWTGLLDYYFEYLENQLDKGKIDIIQAGMFSNNSVLFNTFIDDLASQWQSYILSTQDLPY